MIPSHFDYTQSIKAAADYSFYALLLAAVRNADSDNLVLLETAFPGVVANLRRRYHAPGGLLPGERDWFDDELFEAAQDGTVHPVLKEAEANG